MILMLNLAEHDLAGACADRQRAQVIAVEAAQQRAERLVAERHRRLLDRGRQHDVESDDLGAAVDDRGQYLPELAGPGDGRRSLERRRAESLLVERAHDRGGVLRRARTGACTPAQPGEGIGWAAARRS